MEASDPSGVGCAGYFRGRRACRSSGGGYSVDGGAQFSGQCDPAAAAGCGWSWDSGGA